MIGGTCWWRVLRGSPFCETPIQSLLTADLFIFARRPINNAFRHAASLLHSRHHAPRRARPRVSSRPLISTVCTPYQLRTRPMRLLGYASPAFCFAPPLSSTSTNRVNRLDDATPSIAQRVVVSPRYASSAFLDSTAPPDMFLNTTKHWTPQFINSATMHLHLYDRVTHLGWRSTQAGRDDDGSGTPQKPSTRICHIHTHTLAPPAAPRPPTLVGIHPFRLFLDALTPLTTFPPTLGRHVMIIHDDNISLSDATNLPPRTCRRCCCVKCEVKLELDLGLGAYSLSSLDPAPKTRRPPKTASVYFESNAGNTPFVYRVFKLISGIINKYMGVQHNDVEPRNVLLSPSKGPVIIDFDNTSLDHHCTGQYCDELSKLAYCLGLNLDAELEATKHDTGRSMDSLALVLICVVFLLCVGEYARVSFR
ncbi:hypothetical protein R3P38DRAFT_3230784 [Favolaschia claudopus]|uniref:Protein kinase domain-containing protein n=1 Tax=Favolaschia claudopus TaxID=2862362 RepID=A0AAV9ZLP8_9AGAR